ncbi:MAG: hypothetical protein KDK33_17855 [Leptospiraceae bacterium]|nr:hypothetical protein [Leptospiraceae bacterium]
MARKKNNIFIIFEPTCPNYEATCARVEKVIKELGLRIEPILINREAPDAPAFASHFGSPTVLINGQDIDPVDSDGGCRIYTDAQGKQSGLPSEDLIRSALLALK